MCWELFLLLNKILLSLLAVNVEGSPKEVQSGEAGQGVVVQGDQGEMCSSFSGMGTDKPSP